MLKGLFLLCVLVLFCSCTKVNTVKDSHFTQDGYCLDSIKEKFVAEPPKALGFYVEVSGSMNGFFRSNKATRFNDNPKVEDAIRLLGKRINSLHLHDNDTMTDQHKIPMTGCINFPAVLTAFDEIGYDGVYMLEVELSSHFGKDFEEEEGAFAVKVMRQLLREHAKTLDNK
jgi:hypothetical protein